MVWERTLKKIFEVYCRLYFFIPIHQLVSLPQIYQDWNVSHEKIPSAKNQHRCIQLSILNCCSHIVKFLSSTWEKNPIVVDEDSFLSQQSTSWPLDFDSVKKIFIFSSTDSFEQSRYCSLWWSFKKMTECSTNLVFELMRI